MKSSDIDLGEFAFAIIEPNVGDCTDKECTECEQQFRHQATQMEMHRAYVMPEVKIKEAEQIIATYVTSIATDLGYLKTKVATHGNTIINRWKKMSHQKRHEALKEAHPDMFERTQFLVFARHDHDLQQWKKARKHRSKYLLPYLSVDLLKKDPYKLLALLDVRTRYLPTEWVSFDKNQTSLGWFEGRLGVKYSNCTVSLLGTNYGKIVPWKAAEAHRWDTCAYPRAAIILEAQFLLMRFLRKLVQPMLEDLQGESGHLKWIQLSNSGFRGCVGSESWSAFTNKGFCDPRFSLDKLLDIAKSRRAEATDHLWLLQTDVAYMMANVKLHIVSRLSQQKNPKTGTSVKTTVIPVNAYDTPVRELRHWDWVVEEIQHAQALYSTVRKNIYPGQALPPEFDFAMGSLELLLVNFAQHRRAAIRLQIVQSVGFEDWFTFKRWVNDKQQVEIQSRAIGNFQVCYREDPLFWSLWALGNNFEKDDLMNPAILFNFLDDLLAKETAETKSRLDERLLKDLSTLAAIHELLSSVRHFRPMVTNLSWAQVKKKNMSHHYWQLASTKFTSSKPDYMVASLSKAFHTLETSVFPDGHRNAAWLQRVDVLRRASKDFWAAARAKLEFETDEMELKNGALPDGSRERLRSLQIFDQAPEYLAALQAEREAILAPKPANKPSADYKAPDWDLGSAEETTSPQNLAHAKIKTKSKTRPDKASVTTVIEQDFSTITLTSPLPLLSTIHAPIFIKQDSIRTLIRLYPDTATEYSAKALDWRAFVTAMEDAGFLASRSGGSAVAFIKEGEGRIVLHKPHPVAKIEQIWLQGWGKRLQKWFGWERGVFQCVKEEKVEKDEDKNGEKGDEIENGGCE